MYTHTKYYTHTHTHTQQQQPQQEQKWLWGQLTKSKVQREIEKGNKCFDLNATQSSQTVHEHVNTVCSHLGTTVSVSD